MRPPVSLRLQNEAATQHQATGARPMYMAASSSHQEEDSTQGGGHSMDHGFIRPPPDVLSWLSSLPLEERHSLMHRPALTRPVVVGSVVTSTAGHHATGGGNPTQSNLFASHKDPLNFKSVVSSVPSSEAPPANHLSQNAAILLEIQASRNRLQNYENERIHHERLLRGEQSRIQNLEKMVHNIFAHKNDAELTKTGEGLQQHLAPSELYLGARYVHENTCRVCIVPYSTF
jgi:hypothetical protein